MKKTDSSTIQNNDRISTSGRHSWVWIVLLIGVLMIGAYFRFIGIDWDDSHHLHPDERFLTMVETAISPVNNLNEYFHTNVSSLNPHNKGYGFYVYGTFPLFLVRYLAEWLGKTGYDQIYLVGRFMSAVVDLLTILLVYLIALRLYKNYRLGLIAAAFYAFAVLPIQLSHFFTVDTFTNFFIFLAFYFAVWVYDSKRSFSKKLVSINASGISQQIIAGEEKLNNHSWIWFLEDWGTAIPYALFGIALGMAVSSKVSAAPLALLLPLAALLKYSTQSPEEKKYLGVIIIRNLVIAAVISLLIFRICQPYAFSGPGFFGLRPNEKWISNLKDISLQSKGDVDFPPALQWARRPIWFAFDNMVKWGLGLPLGILAWFGFVWMAWRIFKSEERNHILVWGWTAVYFIWQSLNFSCSMRYQLSVYPTLVIIASWAIFSLWERKPWRYRKIDRNFSVNWNCIIVVVLGVIVMGGTFAWAYAFSHIYTRPITRIDASKWIYQNIPGAINLQIEEQQGTVKRPQPFRSGVTIQYGEPLVMTFKPQQEGTLLNISFSHVIDSNNSPQLKTLTVKVGSDRQADTPLTSSTLDNDFPSSSDPRGDTYELVFDKPLSILPSQRYYLVVQVEQPGSSISLAGPINLDIDTLNGKVKQALPEPVEVLRTGEEFVFQFKALNNGILTGVSMPRVVDWEGYHEAKILGMEISDPENDSYPLATAYIQSEFSATSDPRGQAYTFEFDEPVSLKAQKSYKLRLVFKQGPGAIALYGSKQVNESSWDDPLPYGIDGYNPFDYYMGVYRTDLNFEMYWDDNDDKLERFLSNLDQVDYIFISSNRQWGTTVRLPERYPLTTAYYRNLLGCPVDKSIIWCYCVAEPGTFRGNLGFDLIKVFQSEPNLGRLRFNTQFAEEAFTVYDHPKVLIFKKSHDYDSAKVHNLLESIDLSYVVHLAPRQAESYPGNLMLPAERMSRQQNGGTWSELFDRDAVYNRYPVIGLLLWYLTISILGLIMYPFVRLALGKLADRGYPLVRLIGMLFLANIVWVFSSLDIPFSRLTISIVLGMLIIVNFVLFYLQREEIYREWKQRRKYLLTIELLTLAFFLFDLFIRLGNPDIWHPYKGGEKPMDFSYFNAILKSSTFPPYDPWFAGGYINYYYYGFVLVGVLVKWLGIIPSISYNLILPTLFSMLAMGAFSMGWNIIEAHRYQNSVIYDNGFPVRLLGVRRRALHAGLASAIGLLILGNLGSVRMIWHGLQRLAAPNGLIDNGNIFIRWVWTFQGIVRLFSGAKMPFAPGEWYWIPSRVIPGEPITEFPFFTYLYADLHAHLIAMPLTILVLAWALAILLGRWQWGDNMGRKVWLHSSAIFILGGLAIGSLRPTNTWDFYTYLLIGTLAVVYTCWRNNKITKAWLPSVPPLLKRILVVGLCCFLLIGLSLFLYWPFTQWFGQGYNAIDLWKGDHTPFWSYITHWGLFLFVILSWMIWETREWMATTPASALTKLRPYKVLIQVIFIILVFSVIGLLILGVNIAWLTLPMAGWAAVLIIRPRQSIAKRVVLFMIGTALVLTLVVELIVVRGDIGRMNIVFKFYLQAWIMLSISASAGLIWLYPSVLREWLPGWRSGWRIALAILVGSAALFPLLAGIDKIRDRMSPIAPHTLDGMAYMAYSHYNENGVDIDLSQDYQAIIWMQENVDGSPVIVEANTPEYRWGSRFTIYTGLPGVVGWNWHQRQQRAIVPSEWVTDRVKEIEMFYNSSDRQEVYKFISKYNVCYIIVGELEKAVYQGAGLEKFSAWDGDLWRKVYDQDETVIYEVLQ